MSREAAVSSIAPGSARSLDIFWPFAVGSTQVVFSRGGVEKAGGITEFAGGGAGAIVSTRYRGRWCRQLGSAAAANAGHALNWSHYIPQPPTVRGAGLIAGLDDLACFRFYAVVAIAPPAAGAPALDVGIQLAAGNTSFYHYGNNAAGAAFQITGTAALPNVMKYRVRKVLAGVPVEVDVPGLTLADWNVYEWRFIGPTPTQEAQLRAYVNGRALVTHSYGAGTILPEPERAGPSYGFAPFVLNMSGAAVPAVYVAAMRMICGPTEASLV